jgi:hypothetical protein
MMQAASKRIAQMFKPVSQMQAAWFVARCGVVCYGGKPSDYIAAAMRQPTADDLPTMQAATSFHLAMAATACGSILIWAINAALFIASLSA